MSRYPQTRLVETKKYETEFTVTVPNKQKERLFAYLNNTLHNMRKCSG